MKTYTEKECSKIIKEARIELKKKFRLIEAPIPAARKSIRKEKIYEGSDKADGVEIYKAKRTKAQPKDLLLPYKENKNTVLSRNPNKLNDIFQTPVIEKHGKYFVVRDDLLRGGSKSRMIYGLISSGDNDVWVYASPAQGYAQIAIALTASLVGKKAVIYVAKSAEMHPLTKEAHKAGAEIRMVPMGFLSNVTAKAIRYVQQHSNSKLVPFGADDISVIKSLGACVKGIYKPKQVWSICSTGTLSRGLQNGWPKAEHHGVMVGHIPTAEQRGNCKVYISPELYNQKAKYPPPFPSASCYDAKVWRFTEFAAKDALIWNVGA